MVHNELESVRKQLREAEIRYSFGKNVSDQNKANFDMMVILNKIKKIQEQENG